MGMVVPIATSYFIQRLIEGITSVLSEQGYELIIMTSGEDYEGRST